MVQESEALTLYGMTVVQFLEWVYLDESSPSGLRWARFASATAPKGSVFGSYSETVKFPSWRAKINGTPMIVARVLWFLLSGRPPVGVIDHRNGNTKDHTPTNLRDVGIKVNCENRLVSNPTGTPGVYLVRDKYGNLLHRCQGTDSGGKRWSKIFAVRKYGFEQSFELAVKHRLTKESENSTQSRRATIEP